MFSILKFSLSKQCSKFLLGVVIYIFSVTFLKVGRSLKNAAKGKNNLPLKVREQHCCGKT